MPLQNHFVPPLSQTRPWEGFHSTWATMLAQQLNRILPAGYVAIPQTSRGPHVEIDVAALALSECTSPTGWKPGEPTWGGRVEWSDRDLFEVRVTYVGDTPRLAGAIELVSPANKDRPTARQTFAGKCAGYLRNQVGLIVVDVVTVRHHDLHRELLELLELDVPPDAWQAADSPLYAVSYRTIPADDARLELWPRRLDLGASLPTLPFWIAPDLPIPVDLEASYAAACELLRMS
ncbi:hypothetical protein [Limnoglobus roseus]|uniref:DUF4058 domain-containing protein n=1 Tax=Limnoglobus roseus TaxID=2598579 RepID=A0A5C1AEB9_9BACT|nr:hypothetical protein [Limnoglobus roseus]QEL17060.1 hypothetical protein PX52LOC_04036 [Limnoglobus roseus]